jgi:hypothetical protein
LLTTALLATFAGLIRLLLLAGLLPATLLLAGLLAGVALLLLVRALIGVLILAHPVSPPTLLAAVVEDCLRYFRAILTTPPERLRSSHGRSRELCCARSHFLDRPAVFRG